MVGVTMMKKIQQKKPSRLGYADHFGGDLFGQFLVCELNEHRRLTYEIERVSLEAQICRTLAAQIHVGKLFQPDVNSIWIDVNSSEVTGSEAEAEE